MEDVSSDELLMICRAAMELPNISELDRLAIISRLAAVNRRFRKDILFRWREVLFKEYERKVLGNRNVEIPSVTFSGPQLCRFFNTKRGCRNGTKCRFLHQKEGEVPIMECISWIQEARLKYEPSREGLLQKLRNLWPEISHDVREELTSHCSIGYLSDLIEGGDHTTLKNLMRSRLERMIEREQKKEEENTEVTFMEAMLGSKVQKYREQLNYLSMK